MKCLFCFAERDVPKLTKEHLLSRPIADTYGLDRTGWFGQLGETGASPVVSRLTTAEVRSVCKQCNEGWMNALEHRMAAVAEWIASPDSGLTWDHFNAIREWTLKTYFILHMMVGGMKRFGDDPDAPAVIPNFTRARQLYENDGAVFDGLVFGLAKPYRRSRFAYAFGNPTVVPQGPRYASRKSAGAAIISLGPLQVWVVDPTFSKATITLPRRVVAPRPGVAFRSLRGMPLVPDLDEIVVDNGEHDILALTERLTRWAQQYEGD